LSDALTDIARDARRQELLSRIDRAEEEFLAAPSAEKARELEELWRQYARLPQGYWGGPNAVKAHERIAFYRDWKPGAEEWLARVRRRGTRDIVLRIGMGFVSNARDLEDLVMRALAEQVGEPVDLSVFRIKVTLEAERVTCRSCPLFGFPCLVGVTCNSRVEEELVARKQMAERGRVLDEGAHDSRGRGV